MKWSYILIIILTLLLTNSCNSDNAKNSRSNKETQHFFRQRYQPIWQLLSVKYSVEMPKVESITLAYMKSYETEYYYLVKKGEVSKEDEQEVQSSYTKDRDSNDLINLIADLSRQNNLPDSTTAKVIFDFIVLDNGNKLSDDVNSKEENK